MSKALKIAEENISKRGGVRDMQANEIGDADATYLFAMQLTR
jgi:hypothetical protein